MALVPFAAQAVELGTADSLDLLRRCRVGRVLFTDGALPAALPVFYAIDADDHIVFRTQPGSTLARKADGAIVGFEVDVVDVDSAAGWSVLVHGLAGRVRDAELERANDLPLPTWPGDDRTVFLRIEPARVNGRHVPRRITR